MPEQKRTMTLLGTERDVYDVPIIDMKEAFNDYTLEDGSTLVAESRNGALTPEALKLKSTLRSLVSSVVLE